MPAGPLAVHFCAGVAGISVREYTASARALADSVIRYAERYRPDAVWVSADTWVSAEAMGAKVRPVDDDQPWCGLGEPTIVTLADLARIPPADSSTQGRYPLMIEALERVVQALGNDLFVVACFDQYPFSLAAALLGISQMMVKLKDDPPFVEAVMERALEYGVAYGRAMALAGADLLSGGDSPAGLVGVRTYREFAWPYERRLISSLQSLAGKPLSLHICGKAEPLLKDMSSTGATVLEVDHHVDLRVACRIVGPTITLWGNLDPAGVLARENPAEVASATRAAIEAIASAGHRRFVLSSGCTLAIETPPANLEAMLREAWRSPWRTIEESPCQSASAFGAPATGQDFGNCSSRAPGNDTIRE